VKYYVTIGSTMHEVELDGGRAVVDGVAVDPQLAAVPGTPLYHLLIGAASWTVAAEALDGTGVRRWALGVAGERVEVAVVDERTQRSGGRAGSISTPEPGVAQVRAPMPGLIVRIEVAEGQPVAAGAGLVVVEAMKMENELRAPRAGVVQAVHVTVGQAVEKGTPLVTVAGDAPH
jgi:biotin carboxyl carrier protein